MKRTWKEVPDGSFAMWHHVLMLKVGPSTFFGGGPAVAVLYAQTLPQTDMCSGTDPGTRGLVEPDDDARIPTVDEFDRCELATETCSFCHGERWIDPEDGRMEERCYMCGGVGKRAARGVGGEDDIERARREVVR